MQQLTDKQAIPPAWDYFIPLTSRLRKDTFDRLLTDPRLVPRQLNNQFLS